MIANADSAGELRAAGDPPDLVARVAETCRHRADHLAVESWDGTFTYAQLERLSNQLANRLVALGVGRESRVAISLPRGSRELLALLATSKAGGAYVPLDPSHPLDRLVGIVEDARPEVLIVNADSPVREAMPAAGHTILLDDLDAALAGHPATPPSLDRDPGQLAYLLYTSGSTGRPKGVEVLRGAFANFLRSMAHTPGMTESDRLLAITTTCFDIAGLELFLPLWVGATTVIADRATTADPRLLRRRLEAGDITMMQATPATWRLLLEAGWRADGRLRMLIGGEALSPSLADRLLAGGGELWNMYGPTETTVWSTLERIVPGRDRITIGRPIDATQVYVLDDALRLLPAGAEGEIWIGGRGLARGYFGRPDLTAQRFVQNPHGPPGDLIYRTGDLGRQLADGRFECLGRLDHQVKIRGFRVELGEIESVLRSVPDVAEVLVVADRAREHDPRLVAYWVGRAERQALAAKARQKLPPYMVPAAYVNLEAFPLNPNGKIDRKQLPAPDRSDGTFAGTRPRNDTEARIAAIWAEALDLPNVPVDESFFDLGGTSARAVEVAARIERELGVELPLQTFFDAPTIERIAAGPGRAISADAPIAVWLRRGPDELPPLFCLFGVNLYRDLADALPEDRSVLGVHIPFRHAPGRDARPNLDGMARRYLELVRTYQPRGPYHLLGLCFGGVVAYEVARLLESQGEEVARVAVLDATLPSGVNVHLARRVGNAVRQLSTPREIARNVRARYGRLVARVPALARLRRGVAPEGSGALVDFPVDGPEADLEVEGFDARPSRLRAPLLVVRASQDHEPAWMSIAEDQGWRPRAERVKVLSLAAGHLEILRRPHVEEIATALGES